MSKIGSNKIYLPYGFAYCAPGICGADTQVIQKCMSVYQGKYVSDTSYSVFVYCFCFLKSLLKFILGVLFGIR